MISNFKTLFRDQNMFKLKLENVHLDDLHDCELPLVEFAPLLMHTLHKRMRLVLMHVRVRLLDDFEALIFLVIVVAERKSVGVFSSPVNLLCSCDVRIAALFIGRTGGCGFLFLIK